MCRIMGAGRVTELTVRYGSDAIHAIQDSTNTRWRTSPSSGNRLYLTVRTVKNRGRQFL
jgi:hypothetical protein